MSIIERLTIEVGKIRGSLERLWRLSKAETLNRNECLNTIREIERSLNTIITVFEHTLVKRLREIPPDKLLISEAIIRAFTNRGVLEALSEVIVSIKSRLVPASLSSLIYQLENPAFYKDDDVKRTIVSFCNDLEKSVLLLEDMLGLKSGLLMLAEFPSRFPSFTVNWIIGVVYLSAMEISVKKALGKRGKNIKEKFKENVRSLISCLREEGVQIRGLEELLPSTFWDLRNKIIHEGYSPSNHELKTIVEYVTSFMEKIE